MAEYINREELLKDIDDSVRFSTRNGVSAEMRGAHKIVDRIVSAPTVDVVEVVRCRDCKFAFPYNDYYYCENEDSPFTNSDWAVCPNGDDFCSYGERRCEE